MPKSALHRLSKSVESFAAMISEMNLSADVFQLFRQDLGVDTAEIVSPRDTIILFGADADLHVVLYRSNRKVSILTYTARESIRRYGQQHINAYLYNQNSLHPLSLSCSNSVICLL